MSVSIMLVNHLPEGEVEIPEGYKRCCSCRTIKHIGLSFYQAKVSYHNKHGVQRECKVCDSARKAKWYKDNTVQILTKTKTYRHNHSDQYEEYHKNYYSTWLEIIDEKLHRSCCVCGYNKCWKALEFHHIDPTTKSFNISQMINRWSSKPKHYKKLIQELDKCVLLCANCHRELHANFFELTEAHVLRSRKEN
jgi:hypothetical protein